MELPKSAVLTLKTDELNVIGFALQKLAYEISAPVINEINRQIAEQNKPDVQDQPPAAETS